MLGIKSLIAEEIETILESQKYVDTILDKIGKEGIDSLTTYEKNALDSISKGKEVSLENDVLTWLDDNYGKLTIKKEKRESFNKTYNSLVFYDKKNREIFIIYNKPKDRSVYISYDLVWDHLLTHFGMDEKESSDILKYWLETSHSLKNPIPTIIFI